MRDLMNMDSDRFRLQAGHRVSVQVPEEDATRVLEAVLAQDPLCYGDYDQVAFVFSPGTQQFRSLPGGRNAATEVAVFVSCVELSFFTDSDAPVVERILKAIYRVHPYEEPVIQIAAAMRTLHRPGTDEDNPNRFWNRPDADWVPQIHRKNRSISVEKL